MILKIPGAITLSLFTTVDSREEGTEFEVTGFDKAFVSPTFGKAKGGGGGVRIRVTAYSLGSKKKKEWARVAQYTALLK
ncbi:hypothetical protein Tco_0781494 [Tanacetum coccineum]